MKILNELYVQELLDAILILATLAIIKISGHSKLGSLEVKGNHLTDISVRNIVLKGTNSSQTSVMVQSDIFPNDNFKKLAREAQQLTLEKEKHDWKFLGREAAGEKGKKVAWLESAAHNSDCLGTPLSSTAAFPSKLFCLFH